MSTITQDTYTKLAFAYDFFNQTLFDGLLPDCLIVLGRERPDARGTYEHEALEARNKAHAQRIACIVLNPNNFGDRTDRQILSTLVHEMVHEWQYFYGVDVRPGYHNKEWDDKTESLGLIPSSTGEPGGKRTGRKVTHCIEMGGPYDCAYEEIRRYVSIDWQFIGKAKQTKAETVKTVKYVCPRCTDVEARAREGVTLLCGECESPLIDYKVARQMEKDGGQVSVR